jgi:hypothetical protein
MWWIMPRKHEIQGFLGTTGGDDLVNLFSIDIQQILNKLYNSVN